jgi:hypothetical protein
MKSIEITSDFIVNRTKDLPTARIVLQTNVLSLSQPEAFGI